MVVDDKLETFQEDTIRLFNAAKTFEKKFSETSKNLFDQVKQPVCILLCQMNITDIPL